MRIAIIGGGLSGCTAAYLLKDDHEITIYEKNPYLGGLCATDSIDGLTYCRSGAHIFHTNNKKIWDFVRRFLDFTNYQHRVGIIEETDEDKILDWPPTSRTIEASKYSKIIKEQLKRLPKEPKGVNFEEVARSMVGDKLYELFIGNYTRKQWGVDPKKLSPHWVSKRISLRLDNYDMLFRDRYQGTPKRGYSKFFIETTKGIKVHLNVDHKEVDLDAYDLVISTIPVDQMFQFEYGELQYRGIEFEITECRGQDWPDPSKGVINYPDLKYKFTRRTNMQLHFDEEIKDVYIEAKDFPGGGSKMYPVHTEENIAKFDKYLAHAAAQHNIILLGRLGLFNYINMDRAIEHVFEAVEFIRNYKDMSVENRIKAYTKIIKG